MAAPKRKTKTTAKTARAHATRSAYRPQTKPQAPQANWAGESSSKPNAGATFYKINFNAGGVQEATKQATESAASVMRAMQDMWKPEQMQQFWGADSFEHAKKLFNPEQLKQQWSSIFSADNTRETFSEFNRESADQFNRSASQMAEFLHELYDLTRENFSVAVESGNTAVAAGKEISAELINFTNRAFAQNVEISKQVMACRTLNDLFDWAGKLVKSNLDGYFTQSVTLSEMLFEATTDISEPLNARVSETTDRITKVLTA